MKNFKIKSKTCKVIANSKKLTRKEWLILRQTGFGGSDAAGSMNMSKYKTDYTVVYSKIKPIKEISNEHTDYGNWMEPVLRERIQELHSEYKVYESTYVYQSVDHPFMLANIDGYIWADECTLSDGSVVQNMEMGLEIKTASEYLLDEWKNDNIPVEYYCQIQHYMAVTGFNYWKIICLIGKQIIEYIVPRNDELIHDLILAEKELWYNFVRPRILPMPTGAECEKEYINEEYKNIIEESVELDNEVAEISRKYYEANKLFKEAEADKKKYGILLTHAVGHHKKATTDGFNLTKVRKVSKSFDESGFKDAHPKIYDENCKALTVLDERAVQLKYPDIFKKFEIEKPSAYVLVKPSKKKEGAKA